jgi:hypothetical protein
LAITSLLATGGGFEIGFGVKAEVADSEEIAGSEEVGGSGGGAGSEMVREASEGAGVVAVG